MQRQTRTARPAVIVSIFCLVALGIILVPPIRRAVIIGFTSASGPITQASFNLLERFGWSSALRQTTENEAVLRTQLQLVTKELAVAREELEVQQTTDRLAGFLARVSLPSISAAVIGYSPDPGIQSLVINIGRNADIRAGQAVITDEGWLIGKIQIVHETTASVLLLNDAQSLVLSRVQNEAASQGVVRGERGLTVRMELIPKSDSLTPGQPVVTSGLEPGIPPDLLIGTIAAIEQRAGEVFQRALITTPIRYGRVRSVAVIKL